MQLESFITQSGISPDRPLAEQLETIMRNIESSQKEYARLRGLIDKDHFTSDPAISRMIASMLDAASKGDRTAFTKHSMHAYLYSRKMIIDEKESLADVVQRQSARATFSDLPESFGLPRIHLPSGLPTFWGGFAGHGKTSVALNYLYDLVATQKRALVFSLEMLRAQLVNRLYAIYELDHADRSLDWRQAYEDIRSGKARDWINDHLDPFLHIKDRNPGEAFNFADLLQYHEYYCQKYGHEPDAIVIDYVQMLAHGSKEKANDNLTSGIHQITEYAKGTHCPWFILAQTNRESFKNVKSGAGDITAFSGSNAFEQDGAILATLGRHYMPEVHDVMEIRVVKNRMGPTGKSYIRIHKSSSGFIGKTSYDEVKAAREAKKVEP